MRNLGVSYAYSLAAYTSMVRGIGRLDVNVELVSAELDSHIELLAEPVQTVMRKYQIEGAYEQLKEFTRGKTVTREDFEKLINSLTDLPEHEREALLKLKPSTYLGLAEKLA